MGDSSFKALDVHVNQQYFSNNPLFRGADVLVGQWVGECSKLRVHYSKPVVAYLGFLLLNDPVVGKYHFWSEPLPHFWERFSTLQSCDVHKLDGRQPADGGPPCAVVFEEPQLAEAAYWQTGIRNPSVRPLSLYVSASHDTSTALKDVLVINRARLQRDTHFTNALNAMSHPEYPHRFVNQKQNMPYAEMATYRAAIMMPWDLNLVMFHDIYAMNLPLFLPDLAGLHRVAVTYFARFRMNSAHEGQPFSEHLPGRKSTPHPFSPFDLEFLEARQYWLRFTEYLRAPAVQHFPSLPGLLLQVLRLDAPHVSAKMRAQNTRCLRESKVFWSRVLGSFEPGLATTDSAAALAAAPVWHFKTPWAENLCWSGSMTEERCCEGPDSPCFDDFWTFHRCCVTKLSFPPLDDSICGTRGPHGTVLESPLDGIPWVQVEPSQEEPLVFLWDEKSGGTAFMQWLKYSVWRLGKLESSFMYTMPGHAVAVGTPFYLKTASPALRSSFEVVSGHFDWRVMHEGVNCQHRKKVRCLALVRHPVERFLSYYQERTDHRFAKGVGRGPARWSPAAWRFYLKSIEREAMWYNGEETGLFCNRENMLCLDLQKTGRAHPLAQRVRPSAAKERFYFRFLGGPQNRLTWALDPEHGSARTAIWRLRRCVVGLQTEHFRAFKEVLGYHFPWIFEVPKDHAHDARPRPLGRALLKALPHFARSQIARFNGKVVVVDSGDLPPGAIISFHTGTIRRHAQIQKGKAISVPGIGTEPVRVDLMTEIGSHSFELAPGQDVYEVPLSNVTLKLQIREAQVKEEPSPGEVAVAAPTGTPSRKLQTALMMRSYLDNHDVLRQMQELLQDMVVSQPEDPVEYMIKRLEMVCKDSHGTDYDLIEGDVSGTVQPAESPKAKPAKAKDGSDSESDGDDGEDLPPPPPVQRKQRQSVSAEAYGAFNERKAYVPKVIHKDDAQKARLQKVLQECWMFKHHTPENMKIILDALQEKKVDAGVKLIQQGDEGEVMWVIEEGELECFKTINGEEKSVKKCGKNDVFGELALLYNCRRAASVVASKACVLWELDRETFKAICYEAAQKAPPEYDGFTAPGGSASSAAPAASSAAPAAAAVAVAEIEDEDKKADSDSDGDDEAADAAPKAAPKRPVGRRTGVSAEAMKEGEGDWKPPVYEKTPEERASLSNIIKTSRDGKIHMLFGTVNQETFEKIMDAMFIKKIAKGEDVIRQGDEGDYFYIVKKGDFDIYVRKGEDPPKKVFQCGPGFAFGELALLYTCPRSATITAQDDSEVWSLDRTAFRNLVVRSAEAQFKESCAFLNSCDIFADLTQDQIYSLAEVLEEEEFDDDEAIVEQGEKDDKMFILRSGQAVACIGGEKGEIEVKQYSKGEYFGEIALLSGQPRKASVYAVGKATCFYITRSTFRRILGPLQSFLETNMDKYAKYQDAINSAASENLEEKEKDEEEEGTGSAEKKPKVVRKREKKQEDLVIEKKVVAEQSQAEASPAETLADKVAQDFKNPALVTPSEAHEVPDAHFSMFGGLVPGQKFTMDKHIHCKTKIEKQQKGDEDYYAWQGATKLKQATEISILCQKGQKSASDPTPNQDNFFVQHVGAITLYGVCDGHGPFGHLVSFRLVQTLPCFLQKSEHFGKNWEEALKEAFAKAQEDLEEFCGLHKINIEASGAAGSVLVLEEQTVHIAFIGDARILLGSWNRRDSRMIFCTKDHKPELPEEKARLEAAGSEVREIDEGSWRIYLKGSNFPGLTMSRAFGDTACAGISRVPEYHKFLMQPTDQWYAIVASDGIWEFIEGEDCCNMTSKKLRLKGTRETVEFITSASRKRWAHVCGDYCDDITALLIQWNSTAAQEGSNNHSLSVRQFSPPS
ncbi:unnamed protein product [Effrenium voratum]|nr:unnamed protein product [Effrenium voratum]